MLTTSRPKLKYAGYIAQQERQIARLTDSERPTDSRGVLYSGDSRAFDRGSAEAGAGSARDLGSGRPDSGGDAGRDRGSRCLSQPVARSLIAWLLGSRVARYRSLDPTSNWSALEAHYRAAAALECAR